VIFLDEMKKQKIQVVITPDYVRNGVGISRIISGNGGVEMYGRRLHTPLRDVKDNQFRSAVDKLAIPQSKLDALQKDLHLFEAAFASDECIISLDEKMRQISREIMDIIKRLNNILWLNPTKSEEMPIVWLRQVHLSRTNASSIMSRIRETKIDFLVKRIFAQGLCLLNFAT